jgi:hypothetical protein
MKLSSHAQKASMCNVATDCLVADVLTFRLKLEVSMRLNLSAVLLVVTVAVIAGWSSGRADAPPGSPVIVKRLPYKNQTAPIPTTTIFTPQQTGLYRLSAYITQTQTSPTTLWLYQLNWTDDAGVESTVVGQGVLQLNTSQTPPMAWGASPWSLGNPGETTLFESKAGTPVSFYVAGPDQGGGTYSLYFTVERLM